MTGYGGLWRATMKKKPARTPEDRADRARLEAFHAETMRRLAERMAYHRAKLKEERGPDYVPPTLEEYIMSRRRKPGAA
ncbi:MAG: hypothetical protein H0U90_01970 [Actinobacteria bacterium]|nr:hypothetical protein [Actinomycetota bacterium]